MTNIAGSAFFGVNQGSQIGQQINNSDPEQARLEITKWLSPLSFSEKQRDVYAIAQPGTGQWFLQSQICKEWHAGKHGVLWCQGIAGSGKTVLASIVMENLRQAYKQSPEVGIACVYCEYKQQGLQSPENLLASIWMQLDEAREVIAKDVEDLYAKCARRRTKATIDDVMFLLQSELQRYRVVIIIIDGLDECPEDGGIRATFAAKLRSLMTATSATKARTQLMITSRTGNDVFDKVAEIEVRATDEDIRRVVQQRIANGLSMINEINVSLNGNEALKLEIVDAIVNKAQNMFLAVRLHLESLQTKTTIRNLHEAVVELPQGRLGLEQLYFDAWTRVTELQNPDSGKEAQKVICWLSCAFRQLTVPELREGLAVRLGDTALDRESFVPFDHLMRSCHGLVTVDKDSQIVRLVHYTAQDFFDRHRSNFFPDAHTRMAETCLTFLSFRTFASGPTPLISLGGGFFASKEGPISKRKFLVTRLRRHPFMRYAADHWGDHVKGGAEEVLQDQILTFLQTPNLLASATQAKYKRTEKATFGRTLDHSAYLPLHTAVSYGLDRVVACLLTIPSIPHVDTNDSLDLSALHWAVELGLSEVTQLLLEAGANAEMFDKQHETPLYKAIALGYDSIVRLLLDHDGPGLITMGVVNCAIVSNQTLVIDRYLSASVNDDELRTRAQGLLIKSSARGRPVIAQIALEYGAKLESLDKKNRTALLAAVDKGHSVAVRMLVDAGASLGVKNQRGMTLLQIASASVKIFEKRLKLMRQYGDNTSETRHRSLTQFPVNVTSASSESFVKRLSTWVDDEPGPLFNLCKHPEFILALHEDQESEDIIALLLDHDMDPTVTTRDGETLLHLAVISSSRVRVLLEKAHLDVNARDCNGRTPLHYAAAIGLSTSMQVLLSYGADAKLRDVTGVSTLHFAVSNPSCVKIALEAGYDPDCVDSMQRTPLHYWALLEEPIHEVGELLHRKSEIKASAKDAQGAKFGHYIRESNYGDHGHEEVTQWIDSMDQRNELHLERLHYMLRECSEQAARDSLRFHDKVDAETRKRGECWMVSDSEGSDVTLSELQI